MELTVFRRDGSEAGRTVPLDERVFGIEPNDHVIWLDVRRLQATARQGTHKTKEKGEVRGSTRKLYRQKGTGFARAGSAKSPIRKTGGRAHGPRPRSYGFKLNKKTRDLAQRSALTYKAQDDAMRVIENIEMEAPSARTLSGLLDVLGLAGQKVLILTGSYNPAAYRSAKNVKGVQVREARDVSTFDLLNAQVILLEEGGLEVLTERLTNRLSAVVAGDGAQAPAPAEPTPAGEAEQDGETEETEA